MANTVFKVEHGLEVINNANIAGNLSVGGNLNVAGNLVSSGTAAGDFIPINSTYSLGNTSNRWNLQANTLSVQGSTTANALSVGGNTIFSSNVAPNANNVAFGNTSRRWDAYSNNLNSLTINVSGNSTLGNVTSTNTTINGTLVVNPGAGNTVIVTGNTTYKNLVVSADVSTLTGNVNFDSGVLFVDATNNRVGFNNNTPDATVTVTGTANVSANLTLGGWVRVGSQDIINSSGNWVGSAAGFQGVQGAQGRQGAQGVQGQVGAQGVQGNQGVQGAQGVQGNQGVQGTQGVQGAQGVQGNQGQIGNQGVQGTQGVQGSVGAQGAQGAVGAQGFQGVIGAQGAVGAQGATGAQGAVGAQGATGAQGAVGAQGATGATGATGAQGVQGATGAQGVQGAPNSGTLSDDTSTDSTYYPTFATSTSGTFSPKVSSSKLTYNPSSGVLSATTVTASSDRKFKINIRDIENPLQLVLNMKGIIFDRVDSNEKNVIGFIAQDLQKVLPNVVYENEQGLSVSYQNITALLVEAIKEINNQLKDLREE